MTPQITHKNGLIKIDIAELVNNAPAKTFLAADADAGDGTLTVENINDFAVDQILLIGPLGGEKSEIIKTDNSTAPSGTTVTLASNLLKGHTSGTPVYVIKYDQIELSHADTATGSKTTLTTTIGSGILNLEADTKVLIYEEDEETAGFYFARYKETIGNTFSSYTDALPNGGWDRDAVGSLVRQALKDNLLSGFTHDVDRQFCLDAIQDVLDKLHREQMRWPEYAVFDSVFGQTSRGENVVSMPTNIYTSADNRSLMAVRIGTDTPLHYLNPYEFEERLYDVAQDTVRTEASATDTTLEIDNSYDFDDSGSVNVYIGGTKHNITYTGVTRSATAGVLTGVPASGDGSITVTIPVGTKLWQGEDEGEPDVFTVRNGQIEVYPLPDSTHDNMNVYGDYWKVLTVVDSMGDTIADDRRRAVLNWLKWKIRMIRKNEGQLDPNDGYYQEFMTDRSKLIKFKGRGHQRAVKHRGFTRPRRSRASRLENYE